MRVLVAIDSFKGSLSSAEAGAAVAAGLRAGFAEAGVRADIEVVPVADGGEGTIEAFAAASGGRMIPVVCPGPLGDPVSAEYLLPPDGGTVVIESARSCGWTPAGSRRNIREANTAGLGTQIRAALDLYPDVVRIGLGGSATNDWGAGMAAWLGVRFLDNEGRTLRPTPAGLAGLAAVDVGGIDARLRAVRFEALADVDNPLLGPRGAAAVFAPQKGADPDAVKELERTGERFADAVEAALGGRWRDRPGAGAAGGLGFGLMAFLGAEVRSGIGAVLEAAGLAEKARRADLVVTGEGRLDAQSRHGKTAAGVARTAREAGVPCVAFCGSIDGPAADYVPGLFAAAYEILSRAASLEDALARAREHLEAAARRSAAEVAALIPSASGRP